MSIFQMYLQLGFEHITDINGYDHILFIISLCAVYQVKNWKAVLILVTAFTIGHSVTLALAALDIVSVNTNLVEFLIPVTIFLTAIANIVSRTGKTDITISFSSTQHKFKYLMAMFFGLIHGLGFSNYLKSLLGMEQGIVKALFAFNIGLEIGQIIVVLIVLSLAYIFVKLLRFPIREWTLVLSGAALGISLILIIERIGSLLN